VKNPGTAPAALLFLTKNGVRSASPLDALISKGLTASGLLAGGLLPLAALISKNAVRSATPLGTLIPLELGCSGSVADGFDPLHVLISKELTGSGLLKACLHAQDLENLVLSGVVCVRFSSADTSR
jgi:hypothetical protein